MHTPLSQIISDLESHVFEAKDALAHKVPSIEALYPESNEANYIKKDLERVAFLVAAMELLKKASAY